MSVAFATVPELADALQATLAENDGPASQALILASAAIQGVTGQHLAYVEGDVATFDAERVERLWLPERPVVAVTQVTCNGVPLQETVDYVWRPVGWLRPAAGKAWPGTLPLTIEATYSHGYEVIPDVVRTVCLAAAGRQLANPNGVVREQTATYAVTYASGSAGAGVGVALTEAEQQMLFPLRPIA